jgi:glycosyltransferase involved in cell wall biosynthesis
VEAIATGTIVFVTQLIDPDDPVLGFVVPQIEALAARCERLIIIANEVRAWTASRPYRVISLGKERGAGRMRRGIRYEVALVQASRGPRPVTVLAHMCPEYLNLAAPVARVLGMRTLLWYTHLSSSAALARADRLADGIITALPGSYPRPGRKVRAIGHSIDVDRFPVTEPPADHPRRLLALGRTSPNKGLAELIEAMAMARDAGADLRLAIIGPSTNDAERRHRGELEALVDTRGLRELVHIESSVSPRDIPDLLLRSSALVNLTDAGSADKVVFEAMAASRPVIVHEGAFRDLVADTPLRLTCTDAASAADRLIELAGATPDVLAATGRLLRARVEQTHSLRSWADAVVALIDQEGTHS